MGKMTRSSKLLQSILSFLVAFTLRAMAQPGTWEVVVQNAGISAMHAAVTHYGTVVLLDRTNIGASKIALPNGRCRDNPRDQVLAHDCTAHSVEWTIGQNTVRPLTIQTDTWCSSGQFVANGTLVQTGGEADGTRTVRYFQPCPSGQGCDWVESKEIVLSEGRWYATNHLLDNGKQIIVGGRAEYTLEYMPPAAGEGTYFLQLLADTNAPNENDNYYPFVNLLPDGTLFIFANRDSVIYNYQTNKEVKRFPKIPGNPRNYPLAGSSVLLPLTYADGFTKAEILICGGAQAGAYTKHLQQLPASDSCGRLVVSDPNPQWQMETMPIPRCMGDMLILPTRDVLIINGAMKGSQGWGFASDPVLTPVVYQMKKKAAADRFAVLAAGTIPRMYHSTANLLPDGRILLAGSNSHQYYTFTGDFPTELRIDAFSPGYLASRHDYQRPTIVSTPGVIEYGKKHKMVVTVPYAPRRLEIVLFSSPFSTHSYAQGQRALTLQVTATIQTGNQYQLTFVAPPNAKVAPSAYYMLFVLSNVNVPSTAAWVHVQA